MSKRRTHSPEFKAKVAMEAISGRKTIQQIAAEHAIHPIQVSEWKRQLLDGASALFTRGKQTKDKDEGQAKGAELFQQIGRLQMELERLQKSLSSSDARELRKLVDHDHPDLSVSWDLGRLKGVCGEGGGWVMRDRLLACDHGAIVAWIAWVSQSLLGSITMHKCLALA